MTAVDSDTIRSAEKEARKERLFARINKADRWFQVLGLSWLTPMLKAAAGDNPKAQVSEIWRRLVFRFWPSPGSSPCGPPLRPRCRHRWAPFPVPRRSGPKP